MAGKKGVPGETPNPNPDADTGASDDLEMQAAVQPDEPPTINDDLPTDQVVAILTSQVESLTEQVEMQGDQISDLINNYNELKLLVAKVGKGVDRAPEPAAMSVEEATKKAKDTGKAQLSVAGYVQP